MRCLHLLLSLLPLACCAQYAGDYGTADSTLFQIIQRRDGLYFATEHYGNIRMLPAGNGHFTLDRVKPAVTIEFDTSGVGHVPRLLLRQAGIFKWIKDSPTIALSGSYRQDIDPSLHIRIHMEGAQLVADTTPLQPVKRDVYRLLDANLGDTYTFVRNRKGLVLSLVIRRSGLQVYFRRTSTSPGLALRSHPPDRHLGFTRADTLEGAPLPARTCYDVLFYDLDIAIDPANRSVRGRNRIRFRSVRDFDSLQIDLYANMQIDSMLYKGGRLAFHRECNAVYVHFPSTVTAGTINVLDIAYQGKPVLPDPSVMQGGVIWFADKDGKPWAESVCQGSGGSLWWPGKDLLSDKPDSMRVTLTVPSGLTAISNGRFLGKTRLADSRDRFEWYISYPILNYNVAFYIGDYIHWRDTAGVDYYCLPYSEQKAQRLFAGLPAMLALYEHDFGPYPFPRDGLKLVEAPYPMEHQEAVTPGPITPLGDQPYDSAETTRTMWHETAHEWWGNSVSCGDFADLWIHESFATYAEQLACAAFHKGDPRYLRNEKPANKEPIIGVPNVNYFYLGDMYGKGARMLTTLQHVVGADSLWFATLRAIQEHLRYRSVTTAQFVHCFDSLAGADYTPVFDQYLGQTTIPMFQWQSLKTGGIQYRWQGVIPGFHMAVRVDPGQILLPATDLWKKAALPSKPLIDTMAYYVQMEFLPG